jgi:hypothetical protein
MQNCGLGSFLKLPLSRGDDFLLRFGWAVYLTYLQMKLWLTHEKKPKAAGLCSVILESEMMCAVPAACGQKGPLLSGQCMGLCYRFMTALSCCMVTFQHAEEKRVGMWVSSVECRGAHTYTTHTHTHTHTHTDFLWSFAKGGSKDRNPDSLKEELNMSKSNGFPSFFCVCVCILFCNY